MKKYLVLAIVITLLSSMPFAQAAVGLKLSGVDSGAITDINLVGVPSTSFDGSTVTILTNGHKDGVTTNASDETTLKDAALAYGFIRKVTADSPTSANNTVGLDDGIKGQMVTIELITKGTPSWVISKTSFPVTTHSTGWSLLTFDTSGDSITLLWLSDAVGWIIVGNNGVTATQ